jgi:archaellum biogenesis ATPase FlaH
MLNNNIMEVTDILNDIAEVLETGKITYTATELFNLNADSIPFLVEPIIPAIGIFSIVGSSDTGKSMLFRQLALCVARSEDFLGFQINTLHKKVLFIATEDDSVSTSFLLRKQAISGKSLDNIRFHFETDNIPDYIMNELESEPVDLVIIDAWSDVFGQNLNDSALIRATLNIYRSLSNKFRCSIGFLHHTGKRTQKLVPSKDNILSGQGFEAKMRLVMELRTDVTDADYKHLCIVKANYLGKEYKNSSYKLRLDPEAFLFTNTGERVGFENLTEPPDETRLSRPTVIQAHNINNDVHKDCLLKIFKGKGIIMSKNLVTDIRGEYSKALKQPISRDTAHNYLRYLENQELIKQQGKEGTKTSSYKISEYIIK